MSDHAQRFIGYLRRLNGEGVGGDDLNRDAGAMAALRRSLSFDPGTYPKAFPYVEPFLAGSQAYSSARRKAYYVVSGLYALHPVQSDQAFAISLARLVQKRARKGRSVDGVESRLMALLGAQPESVPQYLRQLATLLATEGEGCDYAALLDDLCFWMNPEGTSDSLDRIRQKWARQFYQFVGSDGEPSTGSDEASQTESSLKG